MRIRKDRWGHGKAQTPEDVPRRVVSSRDTPQKLAQELRELSKEIDKVLDRNAEEFEGKYIHADSDIGVRVDDRTYFTELIREGRHPLITLRLDCTHIYLNELTALLGGFGQAVMHIHAEIVGGDRFRELGAARPEFLVLKSRSGSVFEIVLNILFLSSQLGPGAVEAVSSDLVGAYIKDLIDKFRGVVGLSAVERPTNPVTEYVSKIESAANYRRVEIRHEEWDSKNGRHVVSHVEINGAAAARKKLLLGDLRTKLLHSEECRDVQNIDVEDKVELNGAEAGLAKGLKRHRVCLPATKGGRKPKRKKGTVRKRSPKKGGKR